MKEKGCIHIYCGNGKGKTTAATGLAVRAAGNGWPVLFYQFMKDNHSGERRILEQTDGITMPAGRAQEKFSFQMTEAEKAGRKRYYHDQFEKLMAMIAENRYRMLVLDEVIYAIRAGLFDEKVLLAFLNRKPEHLEVVLTGQDPGAELVERADYVSEICKRKHPYDSGLPARAGVER